MTSLTRSHTDRPTWVDSEGMSVVVCSDVSDKESHRQADMDRFIASDSLKNIMVRILVPE